MFERQHTFGGSSLDRYIFEFELPDPAGGGDPGFGDPAGEPAGDPTPPAEPGFQMSEDQYNELASAVGFLSEQYQRTQQAFVGQDGQQQPQPQIDPFSDGFAEQLRGLIREELTPMQQFQQEAQLAEAEEQAMDILSDIASRDGDFDKSLARMRADHLLPEMQQRYGYTPQAAEKALEEAAAQQRAYEQKVHEEAVSRYSNQIATLAGAPGEPGSAYTQGSQERTMPDYREGGSVANRFFGQSRAGG